LAFQLLAFSEVDGLFLGNRDRPRNTAKHGVAKSARRADFNVQKQSAPLLMINDDQTPRYFFTVFENAAYARRVQTLPEVGHFRDFQFVHI
jgi:hypothetical protein